MANTRRIVRKNGGGTRKRRRNMVRRKSQIRKTRRMRGGGQLDYVIQKMSDKTNIIGQRSWQMPKNPKI